MEVYRLAINDDERFAKISEVVSALPKVEGLSSGAIRIGEVQVTLEAVSCMTPEAGCNLLAKHALGIGLNKDEVDNRDRVLAEHVGRHITEWPIHPMLAIDGEDGSTRCINFRYLDKKFTIITDERQKVTVLCLSDQVPKIGVPGPGEPGVVPLLTPEIQVEFLEGEGSW